MTFRAIALSYAFAIALATGAYAATVHARSGDVAREAPKAATVAPPLALSWAPDWLMTPLSRAIADATDPRSRSAD